MSVRGTDMGGGGDSSQDFTQATQEESALDLDEYTQVEPSAEGGAEGADVSAEPAPWGRLIRLSGGSAIPLMPRPEQAQGRALNEVTLGRRKVCEVQVSDQRISSKHCRIYCEAVAGHLGGMDVYVEDMSANGTWINQHTKLVRGHRRLLHSGDEIALLNPYKHHKKHPSGVADGQAEGAGGESGKEGDDVEKLEAEAATFTFINLNRNRGMSHGGGGSLSIAETLRSGTVPGMSSPVLRSSASGASGIFGGARKVEDLYDVREMIGHGTSGEVRRAINRTTGKQVAVKVIETRKFALTPGLTGKELVQEAEMLKRVDHEYIIKLEDIFQTEQALYLVMDLVSGGDLFDRIVEKGVYAEDLAQELLFRVLTAVEYLHSQDIVHRDLKPENILLVGRDNDVDVKITDFGLAKRANKEGLKTFCGTPQYFAPEVLKRRNTVLGVGRYGKEADMWSVGVILYILLSGTHPFHTTTLFDQISHASYSMKGQEWAHISDSAKDLVTKLLTESPNARLTADQALSHPFITLRAAAARKGVPSGATATASAGAGVDIRASDGDAADAEVVTAQNGVVEGKVGAGKPAPVSADSTKETEGDRTAHDRRRADADGLSGARRNSSLDTDLSSTSGAEEVSPVSKSLSPTEAGGASAKAAPAGPSSSSRDTRPAPPPPSPAPSPPPPPRAVASDLPPPQPREPSKTAGVGGAKGRKRAKKEGAGDKPQPPYSQLQMHVVRVNGSEQGGGVGASQETAGGEGARGKGGAKAARRDSNGADNMSAPATLSPALGGDGNDSSVHGTSITKPRGKARPGGRSGMDSKPSQETGRKKLSAPPAAAASNGRAKRRTAGALHAQQCPAAAAVAPAAGRSPVRRSGRGGSFRNASARDSMADEDDIMDYSSEESPAKNKRARVQRGQEGVNGKAAAAAPAAATARARIAGIAPTTRRGTPSSTVSDSSTASQQRQANRKVDDSGSRNVPKLGPLARAGAGSASVSAGAATTVDCAAQAAAGGSAAAVEDCVGGEALARVPGGGKAAGSTTTESRGAKGGKKPKGGSKPQRTMTHLWKRAGHEES